MIGGFVDSAWGYSSTNPANHVNQGHTPTPRINEFALNNVTVYGRHDYTPRQPWSIELALQAGSAPSALVAPEPVIGGDEGAFAGADVFRHISRANAGVRLGARRRLPTDIEGGLMVSPLGIGGFWLHENWNYTVSWESNVVPYYLMGGHIRQALPHGLRLDGWLVNGFQIIGETNRVPSGIVALSWANDDVEANQFLYFGPEHVDENPEAWRVHSTSQFVWDVDRFGLGAVWDVGSEKRTDLLGEPHHLWTGGAAFFRAKVFELGPSRLDAAIRPEAWWDRDGVMFGVEQWLASGTATLALDLWSHFLIKTEYRYDHSTADEGFWYRGQGQSLSTDQHAVWLAFAGYFELAFAERRGAR